MSTQTFAGTLTVMDCARCGVVFGITAEYEQRRRADHQSFYCPAGHSLSYGESKQERELKQLRADQQWYIDRAEARRQEAEAARRSAAAARGVVTKIKKRVAKGVCPCCKRQFADLHRHMQGQHPQWATDEQPT